MGETPDYSKVAVPSVHGTTHQSGGTDEISIQDLEGELADEQKSEWSKVSAKPSVFTPDIHSTVHEYGGSDVIDGLIVPSGIFLGEDGVIALPYSAGRTYKSLYTYLTGESFPRFAIENDGILQWSSGSQDVDIELYRGGDNTLTVPDILQCLFFYYRSDSFLSILPSFLAQVYTDAQTRFTIMPTGELKWGSGSAAQDVSLSRSSANVMTSPDQWNFQSGVSTRVKAGIPGDGDFWSAVNGLLCVDSSNNRLYVRTGGAWKYAALV